MAANNWKQIENLRGFKAITTLGFNYNLYYKKFYYRMKKIYFIINNFYTYGTLISILFIISLLINNYSLHDILMLLKVWSHF